MRVADPEVQACRALVIDSNPTSRSTLINMLRDIGVGHVAQSSRVEDARRELENRVFDIVVCDYHFDNSTISGQELLDDLRRAQLLPYSTVFVMVTGECSYVKVAEAAESALDSYLIKPHTSAALEERVLQARYRKKVLKSIFEAIEASDFALAAQLCMARFEARGEFWLYAARIGAELFLRINDHKSAQALYAAVHESKALPWAKLGLARSELEAGQIPKATRILESLIAEQPSYADAYDVMGRVQLEQGNLAAALDTYRESSMVTPQSITRLQKQGMLAFFMDQTDEAVNALDRTVRLGLSSKMFDCQSLVLLAMLYFDKRDAKEFKRIYALMELTVERRPDSIRLQRFLRTATVFQRLIARKVGECVSVARELASDLRREDFDYEAATNMLAMLSRLRRTEVQLPDAEAWVSAVAQRFCVSKASCEMLCSAAGNDEVYAALIRSGQHDISTMAEKAMTHSVTGSPGAAVEALLLKGSETLNAKLIELAGAVLHRHAAKIDNNEAIRLKIDDLKRRFCTKGTQVSLGQGSGRSAGGLTLRT
ncbi:MAG: response regulator [Rhizobacter sp.]|nr:response regulator [Rhizobacter sp.]MBP6268325.1 response regulator [Rhizobacter sp.]HOX69476.1 response regulator [Burkholderiaceae bacterium]